MKFTKTVRLVAVGAVAASAATLLGGGVASAATVGGLTINPSSDTTTTNYPTVTTNGVCPSAASKYVVKLIGPGGLVGNLAPITALPAASGGTLTAPITQNIHDTLQAITGAPTAPSGTGWSVDFQCINVSTGQNIADYSSALTFAQPGSVGGSFDASYTSAPATTPTTTTLTLPASATYGTNVTFSATEATAGVTPGVAAGTIQFYDNGVALGGAQTVNGTTGVATYTTATPLTAGNHPISAIFTAAAPATYGGSSAAAQTYTVAQAATTISVTGPASVQANQPATFTATVPTGITGSVAWTIDGASAGTSTVNTTTGTATTSHIFSTAESAAVSAVFNPTDPNYSASPAGTWGGTTVTAFQGVTATQQIDVTVPTGSLTIAILGNTNGNTGSTVDSNGVSGSCTTASLPCTATTSYVQMGTPTLLSNGQFWQATGKLNNVEVIDTRAGDKGWAATGLVSDFTQQGGTGETFSGDNLGWTPILVSASQDQWATQPATPGANDIAVGGVVAPGAVSTGHHAGDTVQGYGPMTAGIGSDNSVGVPFATTKPLHGLGAAIINAPLVLDIPSDRAAGLYIATLTFTVM